MASLKTRLFHFFRLLRDPHTLGVRAIVRDKEDRVFLVKHTYVSGWHLPGGGVDVGETFADAVAKELKEEGNIELKGSVRLIAIYYNTTVSKRDHVALYECPDWEQTTPPKVPNREIAEVGFFSLDALPADVTKATRRRLEEVQAKGPYAAYW